MNIVDELRKLDELRRGGALSEEEFTQAKAALLQGATRQAAPGAADPANEHLAEIRRQNELAQLDREWEIEREQYMVTDRFGRAHVPQPGGAEAIGLVKNLFNGGRVVGVLFGIAWTVFAFVLTRDAPFPMVQILFPLFGVFFVVFSLFTGVTMSKLMEQKRQEYEEKAEKYQRAYAAFQQRREDLIRRHNAR